MSLLPILALVIAVAASAFTVEAPFKSKSMDTLHFYYVDGSSVGEYIGDYDITQLADRQALQAKTGCDNTIDLCAKGFEQLNPTDPDEGVAEWMQSN